MGHGTSVVKGLIFDPGRESMVHGPSKKVSLYTTEKFQNRDDLPPSEERNLHLTVQCLELCCCLPQQMQCWDGPSECRCQFQVLAVSKGNIYFASPEYTLCQSVGFLMPSA